jgi:hypothetical protein
MQILMNVRCKQINVKQSVSTHLAATTAPPALRALMAMDGLAAPVCVCCVRVRVRVSLLLFVFVLCLNYLLVLTHKKLG